MIRSIKDYHYYRLLDGTSKFTFRDYFLNDVRKFKVLLRKSEYYSNCCSGLLGKLVSSYYRYRLYKCGLKLGFTIPRNVFGPGLSIPHTGTIVVNSNAKVGKNCRLHVCVNIGASGGKKDAPIIGDNVYIAPGVKIYGGIEIAEGIAIGANSVVNKSFTEPNITIAGVPAKKIADGGAAAAGWSP